MSRMINAQAAILGALVGDALGVPHEFKSAAAIPRADQIEMVMPASYQKTYAHVPYGTWSDDGSQLMCLLDSMVSTDWTLDLDVFAGRLLRWADEGYMQAGGRVFDMGMQTSRALDQLRAGVSPLMSGPSDIRANGNGSLMRVLPAILRGSRSKAIGIAIAQSMPTHGHDVSRMTCATYVALALKKEASCSWKDAALTTIDELRYQRDLTSSELAALEVLASFGRSQMPTGGGYVVDSFWSALWAMDQGNDYASSVRAAISLGNDTDTTACITGGLAGLTYGMASIPERWLAQLVIPMDAVGLLDGLSAD